MSNSSFSRVIRRVIPATFVAAFLACGGDAGESANDAPWRTVADSTGDTIRVRISGDVPDRLVRTLQEELRVGAEDGTEEETFGSVTYVLGAESGGLLVYDNQAQAARLFDADGRFVRQVGATGGGPGEHGHLNGIARAPNGDWLFWDAPGARINRYTASGEFISNVRSPITGWFLSDGLGADDAGRIYVWAFLERDQETGQISKGGYIRLDSAGSVLDTLVFPSWGPEPPTLRAQSPDKRSMRQQGIPFIGGSDFALMPSGGLLSGPGDTYTLVFQAAEGRPLRVDRETAPVPVSDTERREQTARITSTMRLLDPSWNWTGPAIPSSKPAYRDFFSGEDGRIWVRVSAPAEPIPEAELAPVEHVPNPPVRLTTREPNVYEVFSPDGSLLGRVTAPARTRILRARGDNVWAVQQDALEVSYAVRLRVVPPLP